MGIQSAASISSECASHHRDAQPALLGNSGQATGLGRWLSQDLAIFGESRLLSHCAKRSTSLSLPSRKGGSFEDELLNHCFSASCASQPAASGCTVLLQPSMQGKAFSPALSTLLKESRSHRCHPTDSTITSLDRKILSVQSHKNKKKKKKKKKKKNN